LALHRHLFAGPEKRRSGGACATAKIDEFAEDLKDGRCDRWGGAGDLAFVIHLVGDLHQPLHTATDADRGGNCISVDSRPRARNLHNAWDTAIVYKLEDTLDSGDPNATAHRLEAMYAGDKVGYSWKPGGTDDIAWETNQVARTQVYSALGIPVEPCESDNNSCANAPKGTVDLDSEYMSRAATVAGQQLAKAGFRLASLLNGIWPENAPIGNCAGSR
jgi:hypothetical protein